MQTTTIRTAAALTLAAAACSTAWAEGETTLKLGAIRYDTHARTTGITGIGIPAGADAEVGDASTLVFTAERALNDKWGMELVLGVPPKIKAKASGSVAFLGEVLTARNVAPTLFLTHHFGSAGDTLRPYAGLGINYTRFTDVKTPYGWDVSLSDSWGPAAHVGVDWNMNKNWGLWASYAMVHVKSKLVATGAVVLQTTIDFRPRTYSAGLLYRF
jgi:outer membrane protein